MEGESDFPILSERALDDSEGESVLASWRRRVKKGIAYYQEHGMFFLIGAVLKPGLYYYCRWLSSVRMVLDRLKLLKRAEPFDKQLPEVIISLTSYPARIKTVHKTIETLLVQTYRADRIILWLAEEEFPEREKELPRRLRKLASRGLEIRWCSNIRSYKKLIPALKQYPKAIIITFDDDFLYNRHTVERLIAEYHEKPQYIQCHRAGPVVYRSADSIDVLLTYRKDYPVPTYLYKLTGRGGCLYPPRCFHADIMDDKLFMDLAPTNDDIWFWLMGALNGYKVNIVKNNIAEQVCIPKSQRIALYKINNEGEKLFFVQLKNILRYYPELDGILRQEQMAMDLLGRAENGNDLESR